MATNQKRKPERYYSLVELAKRWQISAYTLERWFKAEQEDSLRVPESIVRRVHKRLASKSK